LVKEQDQALVAGKGMPEGLAAVRLMQEREGGREEGHQ